MTIKNKLILETVTRDWFKVLRSNCENILFVGGIIRDEFINTIHNTNIISKDVDILVQGLSLEEIESILSSHGTIIRNNVGGKLATLKFEPNEDHNSNELIDIVIPRKEFSTGAMKKDFEFSFDDVSLIEDFKRRDLTINSIGCFHVSDSEFEIFDPFNGVNDIENCVIKALSRQSFIDDPTRMMRALQFKARFNHLGFSICDLTKSWMVELNHLCKVESGERLFTELNKMFSKSKSPSTILNDDFLCDMLESILDTTITHKNPDTFNEFIWCICESIGDLAKDKLKLDNKISNFIKGLNTANLGTFKNLQKGVKLSSEVRNSKFLQTQFNVDAPLFANELPLVNGVTFAQSLKNDGVSGKLIGTLIQTKIETFQDAIKNITDKKC